MIRTTLQHCRWRYCKQLQRRHQNQWPFHSRKNIFFLNKYCQLFKLLAALAWTLNKWGHLEQNVQDFGDLHVGYWQALNPNQERSKTTTRTKTWKSELKFCQSKGLKNTTATPESKSDCVARSLMSLVAILSTTKKKSQNDTRKKSYLTVSWKKCSSAL